MTAQIAARLGFDDASGVVVSEVGRFGAAANAGIRSGQLVLRLNGERVENVDDFRAIASSVEPGDVVSVRVRDPEIGETIIYRTRGRLDRPVADVAGSGKIPNWRRRTPRLRAPA